MHSIVASFFKNWFPWEAVRNFPSPGACAAAGRHWNRLKHWPRSSAYCAFRSRFCLDAETAGNNSGSSVGYKKALEDYAAGSRHFRLSVKMKGRNSPLSFIWLEHSGSFNFIVLIFRLLIIAERSCSTRNHRRYRTVCSIKVVAIGFNALCYDATCEY